MEYLTDEDYAIAESNGIKRSTAYGRVYSYGWTIKEAITKPTKRKISSQFSKEVLARAASYGVCRQTLQGRVESLGWDLEEAITTPPYAGRQIGKRSNANAMVELAIQNGIKSATYWARVGSYGWTPYKAATTPVDKSKRRKDLMASQ